MAFALQFALSPEIRSPELIRIIIIVGNATECKPPL
jgi:hypothetical protein